MRPLFLLFPVALAAPLLAQKVELKTKPADQAERFTITSNIQTNGNHPSVIIWSIANELSARPGPVQGDYIRRAVQTAHALDPTRPVGIAAAGYPSAGCQPEYASLDVLGPMIFHSGRVDTELVAEMGEVIRPLLLEMGRLAIERATPRDLDAIRRLRDQAANASKSRDERYRALHDLLVVLADTTRNRVWQMLGRRLRALLQSEPLRAARERLRRDPSRFIPVIDSCLVALAARRTAAAVERLQQLIGMLGDVRVDLDERSSKSRSTKGANP